MDLAGFDLNLLRVFAAVMRERSVSRAGEQIGMSQPAVSAALNRLRHALDDQLFVRQGHEMRPTPRAEDLEGPVLAALEQLETALLGRRGFDPARAERTFTLLGSDYVSLLLMPALARRMIEAAPGVRLRCLDSGRADVARMLQEDAADLVLEGPTDLPDWAGRASLFQEPFAVIAREELRSPQAPAFGARPVFPLDRFCELPHALRTIEGGMTGATDAALAQIGRRRRVVLALAHFYAVLLAVAEGGLIAMVPQAFAEAFAPSLRLAVYAPPLDIPPTDVSLYWHSRHERNPAHQWLRAEVLRLARRPRP